MRITKFVHSCLLIETGGKSVLIDPGSYSFNSHMLVPSKIEKLDFIVITHEHADHYHPPFLQTLTQRFPHSTVITNADLVEKLRAGGIKNHITSGSADGALVFEAAHEPLPFDQPVPLNIGIHIDEQLTHPGDAINIEHTRSVLALPITAPWISLKQSLEKVAELKPRIVVPIHDWHWHKAAREELYGRAAELLLPQGVKFIPLENAVPVEF